MSHSWRMSIHNLFYQVELFDAETLTSGRKPSLSIVIPTFEEKRLHDVQDLVESIRKQSYKGVEVVLTTESKVMFDLLNLHMDPIPGSLLRIICDVKARGVNACRNLGIAAASGNIVAIVDDDVVLPMKWAHEMLMAYQKFQNVGAVTGPVKPMWMSEPKPWIPRVLYWLISCTMWDWSLPMNIRNVGGMNSSYDSSVLKEVGPFDTTIGPKGGGAKSGKVLYVGAEEVELCQRIRFKTGKTIIYLPSAWLYHKVYDSQTTFQSLTKRAFHFGYTRGYIVTYLRYASPRSSLAFEKSQIPAVTKGFLDALLRRHRSTRHQVIQIALYLTTLTALFLGFCIYRVANWTR